MKPLFPFYGSKWRDARRYPAPGDLVIEPFAGSAGYSLWHATVDGMLPHRVWLYDIDPIVVGVWEYLIAATPRELLALPDLEPGQSTDDLDLPQEARWLIGFWLNRGSAQPKKTQTAYSQRTDRSQLVWSARARERLATEVAGIRHWRIKQASYEQVPRRDDATYFIDPPYVVKGRYYRCNHVDHAALGEWVRALPGRAIVCENTGADWLPFRPLASIKSTRGRSDEAVYLQGYAGGRINAHVFS